MTTEVALAKPCTVLLVEDNSSDAQLTLHGLRNAREGAFLVEHVDELSAAVARLSRGGIDVALVDLSLPDSSGMETFRAIRAAAPTVPVVVLTGLENEPFALEMLHQGVQDYLLKHELEPRQLVRSLRFALERQRTVELESYIQQLAEAKALLERKNRRLGKLIRTAHKFLENVSHEFRTPITVIIEYASLIKDGVMGVVTAEQQQMLNVVEDRADDLNTMVEDMLDLSKLESGLLGVRRKNCRVEDVVARVWPALVRKAAVKGIELEIEIDELLPGVFCDPDKAGRVLINLTTNALKFCGKPGRVRLNVRGEPDGTGVSLCVTDNGNGIEAEKQQAIFERFKQLGDPMRSSTKGFGLGLAISKELVELNLGHISVESQLGEGSTFSFTLPSADPCEAVRQYLTRIEHLREGSTQLMLVQAELEESASVASQDVDWFLSGMLNSAELLFQVGPVRWLLVLPEPASKITALRKRVARAMDAANGDRREPLPEIRLEVLGAWYLTNDPDEITDRLSAAMTPVEAVLM